MPPPLPDVLVQHSRVRSLVLCLLGAIGGDVVPSRRAARMCRTLRPTQAPGERVAAARALSKVAAYVQMRKFSSRFTHQGGRREAWRTGGRGRGARPEAGPRPTGRRADGEKIGKSTRGLLRGAPAILSAGRLSRSQGSGPERLGNSAASTPPNTRHSSLGQQTLTSCSRHPRTSASPESLNQALAKPRRHSIAKRLPYLTNATIASARRQRAAGCQYQGVLSFT